MHRGEQCHLLAELVDRTDRGFGDCLGNRIDQGRPKVMSV